MYIYIYIHICVNTEDLGEPAVEHHEDQAHADKRQPRRDHAEDLYKYQTMYFYKTCILYIYIYIPFGTPREERPERLKLVSRVNHVLNVVLAWLTLRTCSTCVAYFVVS